MPLLNDNVAAGLRKNDNYQVGVSNVDADSPGSVEQGVLLPFPKNPAATWVYYDCTVGVMLDSGIVVHNRLPQVDPTPDTLASCNLDDSKLEELKGGVNLRSNDQYTDIVQRMGHARYWFRLWGQAIRIGLQVPIPGMRSIGGVPAIPYDKNPQWAYNRIAPGGNYSGFILWHAVWSLWYTTAVPPGSNVFPAANPWAHLNVNSKPPDGVQMPYTQPDDDAVASAPNINTRRDNTTTLKPRLRL